MGQFLAVKPDFAALNKAVVVQQLQDAHGGDGLAGAGLTHDAQNLAGVHRIADVIDGFDDAALGGEEGFQIFQFQKCHIFKPP